MRAGGAGRLRPGSGPGLRCSDKINLGSFGDTNPHLHFHIVPKYEGGFEFGGSFAITNPKPVLLSEGEYQEMIAALREKLGM